MACGTTESEAPPLGDVNHEEDSKIPDTIDENLDVNYAWFRPKTQSNQL